MDYGSLHGDDLLREILCSKLRIEQLLLSQCGTWPDPAPSTATNKRNSPSQKSRGAAKKANNWVLFVQWVLLLLRMSLKGLV